MFMLCAALPESHDARGRPDAAQDVQKKHVGHRGDRHLCECVQSVSSKCDLKICPGVTNCSWVKIPRALPPVLLSSLF